MVDEDYQKAVESWFHEHKFIQCSFKDKDHWYEVLDPEWNWKDFDYRIPPYDKSKSLDAAMDENHKKLMDQDWKFT